MVRIETLSSRVTRCSMSSTLKPSCAISSSQLSTLAHQMSAGSRIASHWSIVPVSILLGGIAAAGGLIQRRMGMPDATVLVLQGLMFVVLLVSETLYGRLSFFRPKGNLQ